MKVGEALVEAARRLAEISDTPRLDADLLMAHSLGISRNAMLLFTQEEEEEDLGYFDNLVSRRLAHEPIAYIIGRRAFWTIELEVGPGVLIPRPDSETLIEAAVARFGEAGPARILDLGTGPGTLLLAALDQWPDARGLGIDSSPAALQYADRNAERLGLEKRARFQLGDWDRGLKGRFDLILCNPPYVAADASLPPDVAGWEPDLALYAGPDGLEAFRALAPRLGRLLEPGAIACVEIGSDQEAAAGAILTAAGFTVSTRADLNGKPRCLILQIDGG